MSDATVEHLLATCSTCDLPIAVYVAQHDGMLVATNRRFREMFEISPGDTTPRSILEFYVEPKRRAVLQSELSQARQHGQHLENQVIEMLTLTGRHIWVSDNCRGFWQENQAEPIVYLGCMSDITEEESFRQLFNSLPVGIYRLNATDDIVQVNEGLVKLLGYTREQLLGMNVEDLYVDKSKAAVFKAKIDQEISLEKELVELQPASGDSRFYWATAVRIPSNPVFQYQGREGTILDITDEERYRRLVNSVPIGNYRIKYCVSSTGIEERIEDCNEAFAVLFGFVSATDAIGYDVFKLWENPRLDAERFKRELEEKDKTDEPATVILPVKTVDGKRHFIAEIHGRPLRDGDGNVVGRAGAIRDVSKEVTLIRIRNDVGRILHAYEAALDMIGKSIASSLPLICDSGGFDAYPDVATETPDPIRKLAKPLRGALLRLRSEAAASQEREKSVSEKDWSALSHSIRLLDEYDSELSEMEVFASLLYNVSGLITVLRRMLHDSLLPREMVRQAMHDARVLARLCCQVSLYQAAAKVYDMDCKVKAFRKYVLFHEETPEKIEKKRALTLLDEAIGEVTMLAASRNVVIRNRAVHDCSVSVRPKQVVTALFNLLHNAVKYSWARPSGEKRWILITSEREGGDWVLAIANYGVAIRKEDLSNDAIFDSGYRGGEASDRKRKGSGIGLPWSREIARAHGGDVTLQSSPVGGGPEDDYKQPFLTTARLRLPEAKE